jgi:hypothetical protein
VRLVEAEDERVAVLGPLHGIEHETAVDAGACSRWRIGQAKGAG